MNKNFNCMVHIVRVITCMRCKSIANRADSSHVEVSFIYGRWFTSNAWPKPHLKDNDMQSFQSWGFYAQQIWLIRHIIRAQNAQLHLYELERPVSMSETSSSALPPTQHPKRSNTYLGWSTRRGLYLCEYNWTVVVLYYLMTISQLIFSIRIGFFAQDLGWKR